MMELVQRAMIKAAESFGSEDGTFNAAGFARAMIELSGIEQKLDGGMVLAILEGRLDVERLHREQVIAENLPVKGTHYRFKGIVSRTEEARRKGILIVCVDFDGVLHSYDSGWKGPCEIPDPPVPGALDWLYTMSSDPRFEMAVYSSRSKEPGGIQAMQAWLLKHYKERFSISGTDPVQDEQIGKLATKILGRLKFPTQKPAASMMIDDRAFCFEGTFPTADWILRYKPWNKR